MTKLSTLESVTLILNLLYIFCHVTTGSPALQKVIDAVCGYNQQNLKDLACMDGETILITQLGFYRCFYAAFLHTGDLESLNALVLLYMPKKISYRLSNKIRCINWIEYYVLKCCCFLDSFCSGCYEPQ